MSEEVKAGVLSTIIEVWREAIAHEEECKDRASAAREMVNQYEQLIIEQMAIEGYDSVKHNGQTIYKRNVRSVVKAPGVGADDVAQVLRQSDDLRYLLREAYNASSLKGAVLERLDMGVPLPAGLEDLIVIKEFATVGARKG